MRGLVKEEYLLIILRILLGTHLKLLTEALLMSTHNICFYAEENWRKLSQNYHQIFYLNDLHRGVFDDNSGIIFLFLHKNICCEDSLEAPSWGASNKYPLRIFSWRTGENLSRIIKYSSLTIKAPRKICSRRHSKKKKKNISLENKPWNFMWSVCLQMIHMKYQTYFLRKIK